VKRILLAAVIPIIVTACTPASPVYLATVDSHLVENIGQASFGGKVFCAYDVLAVDMQVDSANVYVWVMCLEYYPDDGRLVMGTGSSLPVALYMQKSDGQYEVTRQAIPRDGTEYWASVQSIFPIEAIEAMCEGKADCYNERAKRLENEAEEEARKYYGLK
jgi:hypothetical protein